MNIQQSICIKFLLFRKHDLLKNIHTTCPGVQWLTFDGVMEVHLLETLGTRIGLVSMLTNRLVGGCLTR